MRHLAHGARGRPIAAAKSCSAISKSCSRFTSLERGRRAARRWYWRQAVHAVVDAIRERRRAAAAARLEIPSCRRSLQDLRYAFRSLDRQSRLRRGRGPDAGARHRRQRHDLQLGQRGAARSAARLGAHQELVQLTYLYHGDVLPSFSYPDYQDIHARRKQLHGITGFDDLAVGVVIDREAERAWARDRHRQLLRRARRADRARPRLHGRRRPARRTGDGGAQPRLLAAALQRRSAA